MPAWDYNRRQGSGMARRAADPESRFGKKACTRCYRDIPQDGPATCSGGEGCSKHHPEERRPAPARECATCGEALGSSAAAEVVRGGRHVLVHADTCMLEAEDVA